MMTYAESPSLDLTISPTFTLRRAVSLNSPPPAIQTGLKSFILISTTFPLAIRREQLI